MTIHGRECYVAQSLRPIDATTTITCNYFHIVAITVVTRCPRQAYDHPFTWMRKTFVVKRVSIVFSTFSHVRSFATMCLLALVLGNYRSFSCKCPLWLQFSCKSSGFFAKFLLVKTLEHFFSNFSEPFSVLLFNIKKRTRSSIRKAFETRTQQVSKKIRPSKHWNIRPQNQKWILFWNSLFRKKISASFTKYLGKSLVTFGHSFLCLGGSFS